MCTRAAGQLSTYFLSLWDILTFASIIYIAIVIPYTAGFEDVRPSAESSCLFLATSGSKYVFMFIDPLVDLIFLVDIVLQFHTARWVISAEGREHWLLVDDLAIVRRLYLRGHFTTDLMGQIPWQYMDCIFSIGPEVKMLRCLRLIKLLRLYRFRRWVEALHVHFPHSVWLITGAELVLSVLVLAHWLCCLWFFVGFSYAGWLVPQGFMDEDGNYIGAGTDSVEALDRGGWYFEWVSSFYFAITTMTTIGYGDINATNWPERTTAVFIMITGCGLFTFCTGRVASLLSAKSHCVSRFNQKIEELDEFIKSRDMPHEMRKKLRSFYMLKFPTMRIFDEGAILADLPHSLRQEVRVELYRDIVSEVPLFAMCDSETQSEICNRLVPVYESVGLPITQEGEEADALYVVRFGIVEVSVKGDRLFDATKGDIIGENALLGLTHNGRRNRTCVAKTMCELCRLSRRDFFDLLEGCPTFRRVCTRMVLAHLARLEAALALGTQVEGDLRYSVQWGAIADQLRAQDAGTLAAREPLPSGARPTRAAEDLDEKERRRLYAKCRAPAPPRPSSCAAAAACSSAPRGLPPWGPRRL